MGMGRYVNITLNDLRYLVSESVRRTLLLRESLAEGGAYGHMENLFEFNDLPFSALKELVKDVFRGNLTEVSEKLDGMNVFATVTPSGKVQFARNGGQIKGEDAGMGIPEMEERWGGEGSDPSILDAYKNAYYLFSDAVSKLKDPVGFFNGDGYKLYANCEVLDPTHPNIIHYGKKVLSVHGLIAYTIGPEVTRTEIPQEEEKWRMEVLRQILPTVESQYGASQVTPYISFEKIEEGVDNIISEYISDIDELKRKAGIASDDMKIIDYKRAMIMKDIGNSDYQILLNTPFSDTLIKRWSYIDKGKNEKPEEIQKLPNITQIKKAIKESGIENAAVIISMVDSYEKNRLPGVFNKLMYPLELFVYKLGNGAIKLFRGFSNEGYEEEAILKLRQQLEDAKSLVANSNDEDENEKLGRCLQFLKDLGDEVNATEGIVFNYDVDGKTHTFKLTGSFAALNRAINSRISLERKERNKRKNQGV